MLGERPEVEVDEGREDVELGRSLKSNPLLAFSSPLCGCG